MNNQQPAKDNAHYCNKLRQDIDRLLREFSGTTGLIVDGIYIADIITTAAGEVARYDVTPILSQPVVETTREPE